MCQYTEQRAVGTQKVQHKCQVYFRRHAELRILDWLMRTLYTLGNHEMIFTELYVAYCGKLKFEFSGPPLKGLWRIWEIPLQRKFCLRELIA